MSVKHCCNYTKVRYECINGYKLIEGDRTHHCKDGILYGKQPRCRFPKGKVQEKKLSDIDADNNCFLVMNVFIVNAFLTIITITTFTLPSNYYDHYHYPLSLATIIVIDRHRHYMCHLFPRHHIYRRQASSYLSSAMHRL